MDQKQVMVQNGMSLPFDRLLIATGADPRPIKAEGLDLKNIFFMRTEAHIRNMLAVIPKTQKALVLGGGLVGFKAEGSRVGPREVFEMAQISADFKL